MFRQPLVLTASNIPANWPNRRFFFQEKVLGLYSESKVQCFPLMPLYLASLWLTSQKKTGIFQMRAGDYKRFTNS
jgi:hypothetical protein